ncbi:MAG: hypothetical protein ABIJ42_01570 [Acidobacteriota bacterium]
MRTASDEVGMGKVEGYLPPVTCNNSEAGSSCYMGPATCSHSGAEIINFEP